MAARTGFLAEAGTRRLLPVQVLQPLDGLAGGREIVRRDLVAWERIISAANLSFA